MRLIGTEQCAAETSAYYFERPSGFEFVPGQFVEVSLEAASPSDPFRSFSIASAPCEPHLMIATRSRDSAFKQALRSLAPGSEVQIDGPFGDLRLQGNAVQPHVFIAGGIGITPFRSILTQAAAEGNRETMLLFHANRDIAGSAFQKEMADLALRVSAFRFILTLTRPSDGWTGETGYIDAAMLSRHLDPLTATYYVSGPPAMVEAMTQMLGGIGVAVDKVFAESFEGY